MPGQGRQSCHLTGKQADGKSMLCAITELLIVIRHSLDLPRPTRGAAPSLAFF